MASAGGSSAACLRSRSLSTSASRTSPSSAAIHFSSFRSAATHSSSSRRRKVRRSDRSRRVATRAWCTSSGSSPRRTPGSWRMSRFTPLATVACTSSVNVASGWTAPTRSAMSGGSVARPPRARTILETGSGSPAPAKRSRSATAPSRSFGASRVSSTSIWRNRSATRRPSSTETSSSSISASGRWSASRSSTRRRLVTSLPTGTKASLRM